MRAPSIVPRVVFLLASLLGCSSESGETPQETGETGNDPACSSATFRFWLMGPFGTDSPTDAPLLQALSYDGPGRGTTCSCGSDCTNQPVDVFEFDMFGLASLPDCFTIEYAARGGETEGAWIVFRNANEGSAGEFVLAAGTDPATVPPSMAGFTLEQAGATDCSEGSHGGYATKRIRYSWGAASLELDNGESGALETPMGSMTIYNVGSASIYEGIERWGWIMVPVGTVLDG